jgi:hypothetical protein
MHESDVCFNHFRNADVVESDMCFNHFRNADVVLFYCMAQTSK